MTRIGMEFGWEKCVILIISSGKRQTTEGIELPNQERIRTSGEKKTYKYLGILEADTIKQVEMREKKRILQENEKTTQNQTTLQKPHQRDEYLSCPPCKILGTILKVDKLGDLAGHKFVNGLNKYRVSPWYSPSTYTRWPLFVKA